MVCTVLNDPRTAARHVAAGPHHRYTMQFKHLPAIFSFHDAILDNANYAVMNKKKFEILIDHIVPLDSPFVERKRTYSPFNRLHQTSLVCASQTINNSVIQSVIQVPSLDFFSLNI